MKSKRNMTTRILIIVFALAVLIEIGYAVLGSNIKINGSTKINETKWNVHFTNVQYNANNVLTDKPATIDAAETTVNYEVNLKNPGDFYEFTVDVFNEGTIDAMLSTITNSPLTAEQQKYLTYTVKYSSGAAIAEKQLLAATKKETFKVRVEFRKDITAADLPSAETTLTLTFSADYVQADSTAVAVVHEVCRRATTLHTETCNSESGYGCLAAGIIQGGEITYGNLGTAGAPLAAGDAFDCDVNGDGRFNAATERFYYVSDLDTNTEYAVLVYYNNVAAGTSNNTVMFAYDAANTPRTNGPKTAIEQLPTTEQWKRVSLTSTTRAIKDETGTIHKADFSYAGKTARMLTAQEVNAACGITVGNYTIGELDSCKYLMENTKYSDSSLPTYGYWLENVKSAAEDRARGLNGSDRRVGSSVAGSDSLLGVRPTIEVLKSKISS